MLCWHSDKRYQIHVPFSFDFRWWILNVCLHFKWHFQMVNLHHYVDYFEKCNKSRTCVIWKLFSDKREDHTSNLKPEVMSISDNKSIPQTFNESRSRHVVTCLYIIRCEAINCGYLAVQAGGVTLYIKVYFNYHRIILLRLTWLLKQNASNVTLQKYKKNWVKNGSTVCKTPCTRYSRMSTGCISDMGYILTRKHFYLGQY